MFTGIIEEVGVVRALERAGDHVRLSVRALRARDGLQLGDSVSVDGACLTITALDDEGFEVGLAPETLRRTTLGSVQPGTRVNLERALAVGGRLGGHIVQGHVDGVAHVVDVRPEGDSLLVTYEVPDALAPYIVEKGFVAVDGVSLTVAARSRNRFSVALVAYTQEHVALVDKRVGDAVNIEVDIIAKYVESVLGSRRAGDVTARRDDAAALAPADG
ncbi:MAG TPA: riboflavin synthase [Gemmatimonadales bacterium]|nr:riboflavin synthase [Gemmatimonadales bacterium]